MKYILVVAAVAVDTVVVGVILVPLKTSSCCKSKGGRNSRI